jgi:hypothetical protein
LPGKAPTATPKAAAAAAQPQAGQATIEPQAAPVIIEPQATQAVPLIAEPQAEQPAIIVVEPQALEAQPETLQPSILDLSATPAQVVPLPTGMEELGSQGAETSDSQGAADVVILSGDAVEPSVTRLALVVTALPPAPLVVEEPTIPAEIGVATPVPTSAVTLTPTPLGHRTTIIDRWPKYWWLIPIGFIVLFIVIWYFARKPKS